MTRETLRRFARWAEKIATAQSQLAEEIAEELRRAETATDPLGLHIFKARARYRLTSNADNSKSGKKTQSELETTYTEATKLGFDGPFKVWVFLMRIGKSPEQVSDHPVVRRATSTEKVRVEQ